MPEYELKSVLPNYHPGPVFEFVNLSCQVDPIHPDGIVPSVYCGSLHRNALNETNTGP